jgi:hypothetical protein
MFIRFVEEVFQLFDDAKSRWYLENDIDLEELDEHFPLSKPSFSNHMTKRSKSPLILVSFFERSKCYWDWDVGTWDNC